MKEIFQKVSKVVSFLKKRPENEEPIEEYKITSTLYNHRGSEIVELNFKDYSFRFLVHELYYSLARCCDYVPFEVRGLPSNILLVDKQELEQVPYFKDQNGKIIAVTSKVRFDILSVYYDKKKDKYYLYGFEVYYYHVHFDPIGLYQFLGGVAFRAFSNLVLEAEVSRDRAEFRCGALDDLREILSKLVANVLEGV
jgi:hypothetical protein